MIITCSKSTFIEAVKKGDVKGIEMHLKSRFYKKEWLDHYFHGDNVLHRAALEGYATIARMLIDAGAKVNAITNNRLHWTPLECASKYGRTDVIKILLQAGADPNFTKSDTSSLHLAVIYGHLDSAKMLIDYRANVNGITASGNTPLHVAALGNRIEIAEYLLNKGVKTDIVNREGKTALQVAQEEGHDLLARMISNHINPPKKEAPAAPVPSSQPTVAAPAVRSQPATQTDGWQRMGVDKIAHIQTFPDLQIRLMEVFNFTGRVIQTTQEDLQTRARTPLPNIGFSDLSPETLKSIFDGFVAAGGKADEEFVMNGPPHQTCSCGRRKVSF